MYKPVKILWISAIVVNIASFIFYLLSTYHWFRAGVIMDIVNTVLLQILGIPSAALILMSAIVLGFYWNKNGWAGYAGAFVCIAGLLWIAGYLIFLGSLAY